MKKRKWMAASMAVLLSISLATGCGNGGGGKDTTVPGSSANQTEDGNGGNKSDPIKTGTDGETGMGRFMEHDLPLPAAEGIYAGSLFGNGGIVEYYLDASPNGAGDFMGYSYENGDWKALPVTWLKSIDCYINSIYLGEDGNRYVSATDKTDWRTRIFKCADPDKEAEEIIIPILNDPYKTVGEYSMFYGADEFLVMKDGTIVLRLTDSSDYTLYSQDGKEVGRVEGGEALSSYSDVITADVYGNKLIYLDQTGDKLTVYNKDTGKAETEIPVPANTEEHFDSKVDLKEDGTVYRINKKGIHMLAPGGTLWETVVDGDLTGLSMPYVYIRQFQVEKGESDRYYAAYVGKDSVTELKVYEFEPDIPSVPSQKLTVYSLYDSNTIRQAIAMLQAKNSDVKVEYNIAMDGAEGMPADDYIRALNTELLGGNGADLLLLDGLPVDSYIEKGVLKDMSNIIKPMVDDGSLLPNIINSYFDGDSIYSVPLHFTAPAYVGKTADMAGGMSLEKLVNFETDEHTGLFLDMTNNQWLRFFLYEKYEELFLEDGNLNQDAYRAFLENINKIAEKQKKVYGAMDETEDSSGLTIGFHNVGGNTGDANDMSSAFSNFLMDYLVGKARIAATELSSSYEVMTLGTLLGEKDNTFGSVADGYLPKGTIGVNSASDKTKLIEEFLRILLGEKLQSIDLYEGYPVNQAALKSVVNKPANVMFSVSDAETGEEAIVLDATPEQKQQIIDYFKTLTRPIRWQEAVADVLTEQGAAYLDGNTDLESAISQAASKIKLYEAE